MNILIISDIHDNYQALEGVKQNIVNRQVELILFAGDLVAPGQGAKELSNFNIPLKMVFGNNDGDRFTLLQQFIKYPNLELVGEIMEEEIDGLKIFMNHFPRISELAAKSGEFDLCVYGHSHGYEQKMIKKTLLLNPGSVYSYTDGSFALFDTKTKKATKYNI